MKGPKKWKEMTIQELKFEIKLSLGYALCFLGLCGGGAVYFDLAHVGDGSLSVAFFALGIGLCAFMLIDVLAANFEIRIREYVEERVGKP